MENSYRFSDALQSNIEILTQFRIEQIRSQAAAKEGTDDAHAEAYSHNHAGKSDVKKVPPTYDQVSTANLAILSAEVHAVGGALTAAEERFLDFVDSTDFFVKRPSN